MTASSAAARGHPSGLRTLFFTEVWERFSYYGMRALLVLFMVEAIDSGGLGLTDATATAIYGLYTAAVYVVALPGGWLGDRVFGAQRAIWYGGIVIMLGHFTLAIPSVQAFFLGLLLVILGTGLLKPNISAVVGSLYGPDDPRRDGGFTIFYMGVNLGAALGPLVCSTLGEDPRFGWHFGFAAAGVGMALGLIHFRRTRTTLGDAGALPSLDPRNAQDARQLSRAHRLLAAFLVLVALSYAAMAAGWITVDPVRLATRSTLAIAAIGVAYIAGLFVAGGLDAREKRNVALIVLLVLAAAVFWSGFEQAGSSLNLFAERYTRRAIGDFELPAGWFQTLNPVFIIIFAPMFSMLWLSLARRGREPSTPGKFGVGLLLLGVGFAVMMLAATLATTAGRVSGSWLVATYLLHTLGELTLSPVGLSATTRLAPRRFVGQMLGVWFLGSALGNIIAGLLAGRFDPEIASEMPMLYAQIAIMVTGAGLLMLAFVRPLKRLGE